MEGPGDKRDGEADGPPSRPKEACRAPQRVAQLNARRGDGAPVLAQQGDVRDEGGREREQYAELDDLSPVPLTRVRESRCFQHPTLRRLAGAEPGLPHEKALRFPRESCPPAGSLCIEATYPRVQIG